MLSRILLTLLALGGLLVPATAAHAGATNAPDQFVVATFNVLGADHTDGAHPRRGFDTSDVRLDRAIRLLDRTQIDLVGFQELQPTQYERFVAEVGDQWGVYSGTATDTDNSIAWRLDRFELVTGWSVAVPYFHGNIRYMPVVELRSLATGRDLYVMNTHNPADTRGDASAYRAEAVAIERSVTRKLSGQQQAPVFMTGDMNDRATFFCSFTEPPVMRSFIGGRHDLGAACEPPPRMGVDWIFGNKYVAFDHPVIDRSPLVAATTDHPLVSVHVTLR